MNSSRSIKATVTGYDKHGVKGQAVWLTPDSPERVLERGVTKYGLTRQKAQYGIKVEVPDDQIRHVSGGRGEYVWYSTNDIPLDPKGKIGMPTGIQ